MLKEFQLSLIVGILASLTLGLELTQAQNIPSTDYSKQEKLQFILPLSARQQRLGDNQGRPPRRTSGGSRSNICSQQVVALVPGKGRVEVQSSYCKNESESLLALTLSATPTFWFYIPKQPISELNGEFFLMDSDRLVYKQTIPITKISGVINVIPDFPLEANKPYRWSFVLSLNPQRPSQNPVVEGLVQRIEPNFDLSNQLKSAKSERDRIAIYARNGIWHEAVTELAILHRNSPLNSNWQNDWSNLLNSVGLGAIAEVPLVACCH